VLLTVPGYELRSLLLPPEIQNGSLSLSMTYTYERQDIIQNVLKILPGECRKKGVLDLAFLYTLLLKKRISI
jgi:hypothetical protein